MSAPFHTTIQPSWYALSRSGTRYAGTTNPTNHARQSARKIHGARARKYQTRSTLPPHTPPTTNQRARRRHHTQTRRARPRQRAHLCAGREHARRKRLVMLHRARVPVVPRVTRAPRGVGDQQRGVEDRAQHVVQQRVLTALGAVCERASATPPEARSMHRNEAKRARARKPRREQPMAQATKDTRACTTRTCTQNACTRARTRART